MHNRFKGKDVKTIEGLKKRIINLLKLGWTRGYAAINSKGDPVSYDSKEACKWCLYGALNAASRNTELKEHFRLQIDNLLFQRNMDADYVLFNDNAKNKRQVIKLVEEVQ